jgi:bifunctional UDP-N-acetylglucosamine pyrophosphorylase/glucosamine-1-phosphate N-acetyltransferase
MANQPLLIVVLAAGKGERMRSSVPKVLHAIAGRSMLAHALATARRAGADKLALVVAPGMEAVRAGRRGWRLASRCSSRRRS